MPQSASHDNDDKIPVANGQKPVVISRTMEGIGAELAARLNTFLESEPPTKILRQVQEQTRIALDVIDDALQRYRSDSIFSPLS